MNGGRSFQVTQPELSAGTMCGMPKLQIECPETGKFISTGIHMDVESFLSSSMRDDGFRCPACGGTHTWQEEDAVPNT